MAVSPVQPTQANFVIGPPFAPEEMKVLYEQAGLRVKSGDAALSKRLSAIRQEYVVVFTNPIQDGKSLLQRLLEGILGKEVAKLETAVSQASVQGNPMPCLSIGLKTSSFADGSPLSANLPDTALKDIESALRMAFKAEWVQSRIY